MVRQCPWRWTWHFGTGSASQRLIGDVAHGQVNSHEMVSLVLGVHTSSAVGLNTPCLPIMSRCRTRLSDVVLVIAADTQLGNSRRTSTEMIHISKCISLRKVIFLRVAQSPQVMGSRTDAQLAKVRRKYYPRSIRYRDGSGPGKAVYRRFNTGTLTHGRAKRPGVVGKGSTARPLCQPTSALRLRYLFHTTCKSSLDLEVPCCYRE